MGPALLAHRSTVQEFCSAAEWFAGAGWMEPLAPNKWTPAEVTSHVTEAYRVLQGELAGGAGMRLLGSRLQRFVLRHTVLPRLMAGKPFPPGVRAPRETRPRDLTIEPGEALSALSRLAQEFAEQLTARTRARRVCLSHAYFGYLSPQQGLQLLIAHNRHHARQLAQISIL
jgi:hypothetical protein